MMKRLSLFCALIFLLTNSSFSQSQFGLHIGGALSTVKSHGACYIGCDLFNYPRAKMPTYRLGISVRHSLSEKIKLQTELSYARRGYQAPSAGSYFLPYESMRLSYLSLPATLEIALSDSPIGILLGLEPGLLVKAVQTLDGEEASTRQLWTDIDVGSNFGLAYNFHPRFQMRIAYYFSLFTIAGKEFRNTNGDLVLGPSWKSEAFQVGVAYFPLGGVAVGGDSDR
jgi:hypothetical protein